VNDYVENEVVQFRPHLTRGRATGMFAFSPRVVIVMNTFWFTQLDTLMAPYCYSRSPLLHAFVGVVVLDANQAGAEFTLGSAFCYSPLLWGINGALVQFSTRHGFHWPLYVHHPKFFSHAPQDFWDSKQLRSRQQRCQSIPQSCWICNMAWSRTGRQSHHNASLTPYHRTRWEDFRIIVLVMICFRPHR
jgi:hypothetical protein